MLSKNKIKQVKSLHLKKNRDAEKVFIAEGDHLVTDLVNSGAPVCEFFYTKDFNLNEIKNKSLVGHLITPEELKSISCLVSPQHALAIVPFLNSQPVQSNQNMLILDGVRDPGNLGTIFRLADWFGIRQIILSPDCADVYNPKSIQSSMGSVIRINFHSLNLQDFIPQLTIPVYYFLLEGNNLFKEALHSPAAFVFGNEGAGISDHLLKLKHQKISIPPALLESNQIIKLPGKAESLNVSMSVAVLLSTLCKK